MGEPRKCICGCGGLTKGGSFLPGHDARYKSHLVKEALAGGNPDAERILEERGWTKFLDKAREVAERPKAEPRRTKTEESEGQGSIKRLLTLKAAAKVLKATNQYARSSGSRRIELDASNLEGILTLTLPDLDRSHLAGVDPGMSQAEYFDWTEAEADAVAEFLRLQPDPVV